MKEKLAIFLRAFKDPKTHLIFRVLMYIFLLDNLHVQSNL